MVIIIVDEIFGNTAVLTKREKSELGRMMQNLGGYKICKKLIQFTSMLFGCKCSSILCIGIFL
jgi:hypothetical protein